MYGRVNVYDYDEYRNPHCVHCLKTREMFLFVFLFVVFLFFFCFCFFNPKSASNKYRFGKTFDNKSLR